MKTQQIDLETLAREHALLLEKYTFLEQSHTHLTEQLELRDRMIDELKKTIAAFHKRKFMPKSETFTGQKNDHGDATKEDIAEGEAHIQSLEHSIAPADSTSEGTLPASLPEIDVPTNPENPPKRAALPANLPRVDVYLEPELCTCGQCQQPMKLIGKKVTEELEISIDFVVKRYIRPQYACCDTFAIAPMPNRFLDKSFASPSLLAWVLTQKYQHHMPLNRIEQMSEQHGLRIPRSTLAEWVGICGFHLKPIYDQLHEDLLKAAVLHIDETPIKVLRGKDGEPVNAYIWLYRTGQYLDRAPIILHQLELSRSGDHPLAFLKGFQGKAIMVDQYSGYKKVFREHPDVAELGCMAHSRRKFFDLHVANQSPVAAEALVFMGKLYDVERKATLEQATPAQRHELRQHLTRPILDAFSAWLKTNRGLVSNNSAIAKALDYTINHWDALTGFLKDGTFPIDNNLDEQQAKRLALLRKNSLFAGSEQSGQRGCYISSLIETAKANGLNPSEWLTEVMTRLPNTKDRDKRQFLPTCWKPPS